MIKYGWKTPTTRHTRLDNPALPSVRQILHPMVNKLNAISPLMSDLWIKIKVQRRMLVEGLPMVKA